MKKFPLKEVVPTSGLVFSEVPICTNGICCKPKILPLKSITLEKIEELERKASKIFLHLGWGPAPSLRANKEPSEFFPTEKEEVVNPKEEEELQSILSDGNQPDCWSPSSSSAGKFNRSADYSEDGSYISKDLGVPYCPLCESELYTMGLASSNGGTCCLCRTSVQNQDLWRCRSLACSGALCGECYSLASKFTSTALRGWYCVMVGGEQDSVGSSSFFSTPTASPLTSPSFSRTPK